MQYAVDPVKRPIQADVSMPGSRDVTHQAILLAALANGVSELSNVAIDEDTLMLINILHELGIVAQLDEASSSCIIAGGDGRFPKNHSTVWCGNSLSTAQFMLSACAAAPGVYYFDGAQLLRKQIMQEQLQILAQQGCQLIPNDTIKIPFTLIGADSLRGDKIQFNDDVGRFTVASLIMLAPFARTSFTFQFSNHSNLPYLNTTTSLMTEFGVLVHKLPQNEIVVPAPQRYQACDYTIPPDHSFSSYLFAAAAITCGEVTIDGTTTEFPLLLEKMGCLLQISSNKVTVTGPKTLIGADITLDHFTNSFLTLAAIAPFANSPTQITHRGLMQKHEVSLLQIVQSELTNMGIRVEVGQNWLKIFPGTPQATHVNTYDNPHVALAFSLLGLKTPNIVIDNVEPVDRIYPEFFSLWRNVIEEKSVKT